MISREEVLKISNLARLELTEEEIAYYQAKLGNVLGHIQELSKLKTPPEASTRHIPLDAVSLRADEPRFFPDVDALLSNAPVTSERCFLIPKVVEHEGD